MIAATKKRLIINKMNEGKNIQISRSRGLLSWFWHASFLLQTSPFLFFSLYLLCGELLFYYLFPTSPIVSTSYCIGQT